MENKKKTTTQETRQQRRVEMSIKIPERECVGITLIPCTSIKHWKSKLSASGQI
jgi:hypothetical protein